MLFRSYKNFENLISINVDLKEGFIELNIDYAQPDDDDEWSGDKILDTMEKNKAGSVSSLSHELKHAYDNVKKPTEKVVDRSNYSGFQRSRSGVRPMDQFMFNMYFINQIENLVRPTESYVEMVSDGVVTKEQFLKFLLNSKTYKTLVQIRDSSFDKLIENVINWAADKDILKKENAPKQLLKVLEEVGGILKNSCT